MVNYVTTNTQALDRPTLQLMLTAMLSRAGSDLVCGGHRTSIVWEALFSKDRP